MTSSQILSRLNENKAELASITTASGVAGLGIYQASKATQIVAGSTAHPQAIATATVTTSGGQTIILSKIAAGLTTKLFIGGLWVVGGLCVGYFVYRLIKRQELKQGDDVTKHVPAEVLEDLEKEMAAADYAKGKDIKPEKTTDNPF